MFLIIETIKGHVITGIIDYETYLNSYDDDDILDYMCKFNTNPNNEYNISYARQLNVISNKFRLNDKEVYRCTYAENQTIPCIISAKLFRLMEEKGYNIILRC